jgi:hypothetical protein
MIGWVACVGLAHAPRAAPLVPQVCTVHKIGTDSHGGNLGTVVAASGNTLVAGAPASDELGTETGSVYFHIRSGSTWSQQQKIVGKAAGSRFGQAVAIDDDTALIGVPFDDSSGPADAGAVYVYVRSGGTWTQETKLMAQSPAASGLFGAAVAVSENTALVGYPRDAGAGPSQSGSVYVFLRNGTSWSLDSILVAADPTAQALFGLSIALGPVSGGQGRAVIGAPQQNGIGGAYVFESTGGGWAQMAKLVGMDVATNDFFGRSVALAGNRVLVGSPSDDDACPSDPHCNSGSAYVFALSGTWSQEAKLTSGDADAGDRFGLTGLVLSPAGDLAMIGAPLFDNPDATHGSAYWFVRNGTQWSQRSKVFPNDEGSSDFFGTSIALAPDQGAGEQFLIGAPLDGDMVAGGGALYVMESGTLVTILFESGGLVVNESEGTPHAATTSQLSSSERMLVLDNVQAIFDDALGPEIVTVEEGRSGCINVVVSDGLGTVTDRYGNAGEERRPALVFERRFRQNPTYTTEVERAYAISETIAHEVGHKLGLQGHNRDMPRTIMTAGEDVPPEVRKLGARRFVAIDRERMEFNQPLLTSEPKNKAAPNDLAIRNGSFCVAPNMTPEDSYLSLKAVFSSVDAPADFGYINAVGEFVYQGDTTNSDVIIGSHFDGGFDLAVLTGGQLYTFSNGDGCYTLTKENPDGPGAFLNATVEFPGIGATLLLEVLNADNTTGGLLIPDPGSCGTVSFCTAKTTLFCGTPAIASTGMSSVTGLTEFVISAGPARSCKSGILLYNNAGTMTPGQAFEGGTLCVQTMGLRRAGPTNSKGTPGAASCDGEFAIDMNAFALTSWVVPNCDGTPFGPQLNAAGYLLTPGTTVSVQFWGRDSQPTGSFVSDGLQYLVGP